MHWIHPSAVGLIETGVTTDLKLSDGVTRF